MHVRVLCRYVRSLILMIGLSNGNFTRLQRNYDGWESVSSGFAAFKSVSRVVAVVVKALWSASEDRHALGMRRISSDEANKNK